MKKVNGASVRILDIGDPVCIAMLQAFYSRSPMPIDDRLKEMGAEFLADPIRYDEDKIAGIKERFNTYHVGYGHKSIGELGEVVIFIENVSFLAAKAVQHHPLYKGQEVSTRYVDFRNQPCVKECDAKDAQEMVELYAEYLEWCKSQVKTRWLGARRKNLSKVESNAINAKAFDLARGLLPMGMATSLAWKTDFANAREHLLRMAEHPYLEVRDLAGVIASALEERYPSAFTHSSRSLVSEVSDLRARFLRSSFVENAAYGWWSGPTGHSTASRDKTVLYLTYQDLRHWRNDRYILEGVLDFGSWRDLARHRNGMTEWPTLLSDEYRKFRTAFRSRSICRLIEDNQKLLNTKVKFQGNLANIPLRTESKRKASSAYQLPLCTPVYVYMMMGRAQAEYVFRLRTQETVHYSLRAFLLEALKNGLELSEKKGDLFYRLQSLSRQAFQDDSDSLLEDLRLSPHVNKDAPSAVPSVKRGAQTSTKEAKKERP